MEFCRERVPHKIVERESAGVCRGERVSACECSPPTRLGESVSGVVAEPADVVAGVIEVVRVAAEGRVVAKVFAVLLVVDGLPHGVDSLQDLSLNLKEYKMILRLGFLCCKMQNGCHFGLIFYVKYVTFYRLLISNNLS